MRQAEKGRPGMPVCPKTESPPQRTGYPQTTGKRQALDLNRAYGNYAAHPCPPAMETLLKAGRPLVLHFAAVYGADCVADDVVQSGMLGLIEAATRYNGRVRFSTWASWCIISEIRHYARRERAFWGPMAAVAQDGRDDADSLLDEAAAALPPQLPVEERVALEQALKRLSRRERAVITALYYRGMTQQQTADRMGITQRKVSRVKGSALRRLKELLEAPNFRLVDGRESFRLVESMAGAEKSSAARKDPAARKSPRPGGHPIGRTTD